jgi:hypothetical protein
MRIASSVSAAAALFLAACSTDSEPRLVTPSTPIQPVASVAIVSGNDQPAKAGEPLSEPLVIRVADARGRGIPDVAVSFEVLGDGGLNGKAAPGSPRVSTRTDANGHAQVMLEPYDVGPISVLARAEGAQIPPVIFTANATSLIVEFLSPQFSVYAAFYGPCRCSRMMNSVTVPIGTTVEWRSIDTSSYRIIATSAPQGGEPFDSGTLTGFSRFRFVPTVAGTWQYRDSLSGLTATLNAR